MATLPIEKMMRQIKITMILVSIQKNKKRTGMFFLILFITF